MAKKKQAANKSTGESEHAYERVPITSLLFDPENPRLVEYVEERETSQETLLAVLWQQMSVDEIAMSIAASGYFDHEPLFVTEEHGKLIVIEGNRRLAAVKLLTDADSQERVKATDLPSISAHTKRQLATLPVIRTTRRNAWQYLGFKHVNGPAKWDSYAKAQYIATVRNAYNVPLEDIAKQIGDRRQDGATTV